eukprot:TRINITY_DN719_c0_g2_i3.p1 TRINITY_DN719_c0_g2~~TRINITY_DN719_c0_g2_i3.p1  ORF type:complete len:336 (-),score=91.81 TRINITY_DN719_c0_g2_i3:97-1104(-)
MFEMENTWMSRFWLFVYTVWAFISFYHVVDFVNDFQGPPLSGLAPLWRCVHVFTVIDTRAVTAPAPPPAARPWRRFALPLACDVVAVCVAVWVADVVPESWKSGRVWWYLKFGALPNFVLYMAIDWVNAMWELVLAYTLDMGIPRVHTHPAMSSTVREFWGVRWNRGVGILFENTFFNPIVGRVTAPGASPQPPRNAPTGTPEGNPQKQQKPKHATASRVVTTAAATLATFTASGFFHAWPYFVGTRDARCATLFLLFFVLHGVLCVCEKVLSVVPAVRRAVAAVPPAVPHVLTFVTIVATVPLMCYPFMQLFRGLCVYECGLRCCLDSLNAPSS